MSSNSVHPRETELAAVICVDVIAEPEDQQSCYLVGSWEGKASPPGTGPGTQWTSSLSLGLA